MSNITGGTLIRASESGYRHIVDERRLSTPPPVRGCPRSRGARVVLVALVAAALLAVRGSDRQ